MCERETEKESERRGRLKEKIRREARYQRAETEKGKAKEKTKRQEKKTERQRYGDMLVAQSYLTLCNPMDYIAHQAPLSMGFSRQEYWSG